MRINPTPEGIGTMNNHESLRESMRRAAHEPAYRAHLLASARYSRSFFGWMLLVFGALGLWQAGYGLWSGGAWMSRGLVLDLFCAAANLLIYDKFGDRVAVLEALDKVPDPSTGSEPDAGASPAGREPRHT
jgi:hypothetical protein